MTFADLETAKQFRTAVEVALQTGEREAVFARLAPDVEWITPQRTLQGIDRVREELTWGQPSEKLDVEFEEGRLGGTRWRARRLRGARGLSFEEEGRGGL
jgi:hypothetical protein